MANPWSGETILVLNGQEHCLKLTLGALATLEEMLETGSLGALVERFETGAFSSRDILAVLLVALRASGWNDPVETLQNGDIAGGPLGAAQVAAQLIVRAFSLPEVQDTDAV